MFAQYERCDLCKLFHGNIYPSTYQALCRAKHLQAMGKDPCSGGKGGEQLEAFLHLFQEMGVPKEKDVKEAIAADKDSEAQS